MRLTLKKLEERINLLESKLRSELEQMRFPLDHRITSLERIVRGGVKGYEGLLFRVTFLEKMINLKEHFRPITKKQMGEIRKMMKKAKSHYFDYGDGKEGTVHDELIGKN